MNYFPYTIKFKYILIILSIMEQKENKKRDHLLLYMPWSLKKKVRDFAYSRGTSISSFVMYATVRLMEDIESGKVDIFDVKMDMENKLSPYYNAPRRIIFTEPEYKNKDQEVLK